MVQRKTETDRDTHRETKTVRDRDRTWELLTFWTEDATRPYTYTDGLVRIILFHATFVYIILSNENH